MPGQPAPPRHPHPDLKRGEPGISSRRAPERSQPRNRQLEIASRQIADGALARERDVGLLAALGRRCACLAIDVEDLLYDLDAGTADQDTEFEIVSGEACSGDVRAADVCGLNV